MINSYLARLLVSVAGGIFATTPSIAEGTAPTPATVAGQAASRVDPAVPATAITTVAQAEGGGAPVETGAVVSPVPTEQTGIADIVVFGQRRAAGEAAQKVPIAITALDQRLIKATNSISIADIGSLAPSVQTTLVSTFPAFPKFSIRGIGVNSSIRSVDPAINIIQDGMVLAYQAGAVASTFDLESVEILRGPQGVLFGRNATGGAIVLRTRLPSARPAIVADVSFGNYNAVDANASVEGPLGTDRVLGKIAVLYRSNTGMILNTNEGTFLPAKFNPTGTRSNHAVGFVGGVDELTIKPTMLFELSDATKLTLFGQYQRYNDDGTIPRNFQPAGFAPTQVNIDYGYYPTASGYTTNQNDLGYLRLREYHLIGELQNEIGTGTLTTTLGYRHVTYDSTVNLAGTPFLGLFFRDNRERNDEQNVESRYNVTLFDDFSLTVGGFYLRSVTKVLENRDQAGPVGAALPDVFVQGQFRQVTDAFAGFANVDWSIRSNLKLSAGGRYSDEKKQITYTPLSRCPGPSLANCPQNFLSSSRSWHNFSPRVVLTYTPADRILLYASYTQGFRSGNYNPRTTDATGVGVGPASPENVNAYEVGAKTDLFDRRVRFNVSFYQNDYKDIQQVLTQPGTALIQTLLNAANARIRGVDTELTIQPVSALVLNANVGYTDGRFLNFTAIVPGVADPTKLRIANIPEFTVYAAATYTYPVDVVGGTVSARASYDWRSDVAADLGNTPGLTEPAYGLTNANLSYSRPTWSLSLFARNLFNVVYDDNRSRNFAYSNFGGAPRTYGLRGTVKF